MARHATVMLCVCVSAALVSMVKVMCCIQCSQLVHCDAMKLNQDSALVFVFFF